MVYNEIPSVRSNSVEGLASSLWEFLKKSDAIHGPDASFNDRQLTYDAGFILQPTDLVSEYWCSIHRLLCSRHPRLNRFRLMMWLTTLAFSEKVSMVVLETLASLYIVPKKCSLDSLANKLFELKQGDNMKREEMRSLILSAALEQTPESNLHPAPHESYSAFKSRRRATKVANRGTALDKFVTHLRK